MVFITCSINGLIGLALTAVLLIFLGAVGFAIYASLKNGQNTSTNFTYVATVIAGLVLSVASGVIGAPATVKQTLTPATLASPNQAAPLSQTTELKARIASSQASDSRTLYTWVYVFAGLVCLCVFVLPTPSTHELVKGVALTMPGFLITIVGGLATQPPVFQQNTELFLW